MKKPIKVEIRDYSDNDYPFLHELAKQNMEPYVVECWGKWDEEKFKSNLKKENIKIITSGKNKIGYYNTEFINNILYLHDIQLIGSFQGRGVGKYIAQKIEESAKRENAQKIQLKVFSKNPAKLFYKKLGYNSINNNVDLILMEKYLID